jgi:CRISPR/Cas system-associated exonuclease Cas4 (RecB family)
MGFNTEGLRYAVILVPPEFRESEEIRRIPRFIVENGFPPKNMAEKAKVFIDDFNKSEALKELKWAVEYWLNEREAKPTNKPGKCKSCEYKEQCEKI